MRERMARLLAMIRTQLVLVPARQVLAVFQLHDPSVGVQHRNPNVDFAVVQLDCRAAGDLLQRQEVRARQEPRLVTYDVDELVRMALERL